MYFDNWKELNCGADQSCWSSKEGEAQSKAKPITGVAVLGQQNSSLIAKDVWILDISI